MKQIKLIIFSLTFGLFIHDSLFGASILQVSRMKEGKYTAGDSTITQLLIHMGHKVMIISDQESLENIKDIDLIIITETVSSQTIRDQYKNVPVPCIVSDAHVLPWMGMTGFEEKVDFGFRRKESGEHKIVEVVDSDHPLLAGEFAGINEVFDIPVTFTFGVPSSSGRIAIRTPGHSNGGLLFTYEKGDQMVEGVAPARRASMFIRDHHDNAAHLTSAGKRLLELTILWALADNN